MKEVIRWDTLTESWVDCIQNNITLLRVFQNDKVWTMIFRNETYRHEFADEREGIAHMVSLILERETKNVRRA